MPKTPTRFLITQGDLLTEEPEFLATADRETLKLTLQRCARSIIDEGGDVTAIRVWGLIEEVSVTATAFDIVGLETVAE
jgi:hypothetical protein